MDDGPGDFFDIMVVADPDYKVTSTYPQRACLCGGCEVVWNAGNRDNSKGIGPQSSPIHNSEFGNHHGVGDFSQHRS